MIVRWINQYSVHVISSYLTVMTPERKNPPKIKFLNSNLFLPDTQRTLSMDQSTLKWQLIFTRRLLMMPRNRLAH